MTPEDRVALLSARYDPTEECADDIMDAIVSAISDTEQAIRDAVAERYTDLACVERIVDRIAAGDLSVDQVVELIRDMSGRRGFLGNG
jgi:hypothetical protein